MKNYIVALGFMMCSVANAKWDHVGCMPDLAKLPSPMKGYLLQTTDSCGKPVAFCYIPMQCMLADEDYLQTHGGFNNLKGPPPPDKGFYVADAATCKTVDGGCPSLDDCRTNNDGLTITPEIKKPAELYHPGPGDTDAVKETQEPNP